jgi:hypothetical protein
MAANNALIPIVASFVKSATSIKIQNRACCATPP